MKKIIFAANGAKIIFNAVFTLQQAINVILLVIRVLILFWYSDRGSGHLRLFRCPHFQCQIHPCLQHHHPLSYGPESRIDLFRFGFRRSRNCPGRGIPVILPDLVVAYRFQSLYLTFVIPGPDCPDPLNFHCLAVETFQDFVPVGFGSGYLDLVLDSFDFLP
jgi:hypothetical protein